MTKEEFLIRANEEHGYKYKYLNLNERILSNDSINMIYNDKIYSQKVCKHLIGRCPEKNTPVKTTEEFIKEAKEIWKDKYDYSLVEYKGANIKVKILYKGIIFEQRPTCHLIGAPEKNMNKEYFIKKSIEKWGIGEYDYSLVEYINCKTKVKIILTKSGKIYYQTPMNHLLYRPDNKIVIRNNEEFIKESNLIHNNKYDYSKTKFTLCRDKVIIICDSHGEFEQTANSHLRGMGCRKCGYYSENRIQETKYKTEEYIEKCKLKWGNKYDYSLTKYINGRVKIKIIYDGITYEQFPAAHLKYPPEGFLNQEIFLIRAKRKWDDKYDYSMVNYISTKIPIKIIYKDVVYEQLPHNHLIYAPELRNKRTNEEFINDSIKIHNGKYKYHKTIYVKEKKRVIITCPLHGDFIQTPSVHLRGSGCKKCNESFGEKNIANFLNKNNIFYIREHKFEDCKNKYQLPFDFYISSLRTCIEFDGIQHFQPVEYFGGQIAYEKLKINDKIKSNYCEDNYIDLIRIRYDQIDKIEEILNNNLSEKLKLIHKI